MADTTKISDFGISYDFTGALVHGTNAAGQNKRFPLANLVRNNLGQFRTTDPAPVSPLPNQSYDLIGTGVGQSPSGTYANLVAQGGGPLVIPAPNEGNAIINARAVWSGSYWVPVYQQVSYRIMPPGTYTFGNYNDQGGQGLVVDGIDADVSHNRFARNGGNAGAANGRPLCALYAKGNGLTITANKFADSGNSTTAANDVYLLGSGCVLQGNQSNRAKGTAVVIRGNRNLCDNIVTTAGGAGYAVQGNRNTIRGLVSNCNGGGVDIITGNDNVIDITVEGNSTFDVRIARGCVNTVVYKKPGMIIIDQGTSTQIK